MAFCAMAVVSGHMLVVEEAEYLLLTAQDSCKWFCPLCIRTKNSSSSLLDMNTLLQPQIHEVSTPGASETTLQHSHSENCAKKRSAKHKNYYEKHKVRILSNRKQNIRKMWR